MWVGSWQAPENPVRARIAKTHTRDSHSRGSSKVADCLLIGGLDFLANGAHKGDGFSRCTGFTREKSPLYWGTRSRPISSLNPGSWRNSSKIGSASVVCEIQPISEKH